MNNLYLPRQLLRDPVSGFLMDVCFTWEQDEALGEGNASVNWNVIRADHDEAMRQILTGHA